jgi:hypothetical protein
MSRVCWVEVRTNSGLIVLRDSRGRVYEVLGGDGGIRQLPDPPPAQRAMRKSQRRVTRVTK